LVNLWGYLCAKYPGLRYGRLAGEDASAWDAIRRSNKRKQGPELLLARTMSWMGPASVGIWKFLVEGVVYVMSSGGGKIELRLDSTTAADSGSLARRLEYDRWRRRAMKSRGKLSGLGVVASLKADRLK